MRHPSLQRTTALSLFMHITFLVAALFLLRRASNFSVPSPYMISLVGPDAVSGQTGGTGDTSLADMPEKAISENVEEAIRNAKYISDSISEIKAKKKVEKIIGLRTKISLGKPGNLTAERRPGPSRSAVKGDFLSDYRSKIAREIEKNWVCPDMGDAALEAVISIRVKKDGTFSIQGFEKKSGNTFYDRSALKALEKTGRLSPIPYDMEIELRFNPNL